MIIISGDGRLTTTFAKNRINTNNYKIENKNTDNTNIEDNFDYSDYDLSNIDYDIIDETYVFLSSYLTFMPNSKSQVGKTIRVRGFITKDKNYVSNGYFGIGKFEISCCAADATFLGFIVKDSVKVLENDWYEIEGVLESSNSNDFVLYINPINVKKIKSKDEEQYVYPCYSYGDGSCSEINKYNIE